METGPTSIHLSRHDPSRNMARFYVLEIAPDLFGGVVLIRNWGRAGHRGQERRHWFASVEPAERERDIWRRRKLRRGYENRDPPAGHG